MNDQYLRSAQDRWQSAGQPVDVLTLGLDLSLTGSGVVLWQEHGQRVRAHRRLSTQPVDLYDALPRPAGLLPSGKYRGNDEQRIEWISDRIEWLVQRYEGLIGLALIEDYAFGKQSNNLTGVHELGGVVKNLLVKNDVPYVTRAISTIKVFATGDNTASKLDMIGAAKPFFPRVWNNDEADALHMARLAHKLLVGPPPAIAKRP